MKKEIIESLRKALSVLEIDNTGMDKLIEIPKNKKMGDYALPCFTLKNKKNTSPNEIAKKIALEVKLSRDIEKIVISGPYLNIFINKSNFVKKTIKEIIKNKNKYGFSKSKKEKKVLIEYSSPNIAKSFGVGHLRSTIIGNSIANIYNSQGYKVIRLNYLGDWGTPFGKILIGYKKFGNPKKIKDNPIKHLQEIYTKVNKNSDLDEESRNEFKKLEEGDKKIRVLWKKFRELSIKEFDKIYEFFGIEFDKYDGESNYKNKINSIMEQLNDKKLIEKSDGALIINLEKYGLGVALIRKSDGTTLYLTRDLAAAIDRKKRYKFNEMIYEVGSEQKLHFKQLFEIIKLLGYEWASSCRHVVHGFYLDRDGKKFSTRKGKTVSMEEIISKTKKLVGDELDKREKLNEEERRKRTNLISRAAIIYGDLKNFRENDSIFDIRRFTRFEGNTGPYLMYSFARSCSILKKASKVSKRDNYVRINKKEFELAKYLRKFPEILQMAKKRDDPSLLCDYSYDLCKIFNEFYHSCNVIGSKNEKLRLSLVECFKIVLGKALALLGIKPLERM